MLSVPHQIWLAAFYSQWFLRWLEICILKILEYNNNIEQEYIFIVVLITSGLFCDDDQQYTRTVW